MSDARGNGKGVLLRRSLAAWLVPAVLAIGGGTPAVAGAQGTGAQGAARGPSFVVCGGYSSCSADGHSSHGYAAHAGGSYWRMYPGDNCTNYVAYVESTAYRVPAPGYLLGDAGQWSANAAAHGIVVNHVPSVGAVAEWDAGAPGMGSGGHVAVVEKVGPNDRYIVISQQAIGSDPDGYDWTRINAGFPASDWQEWPEHFIHFRVQPTTTAGYYNPRTTTFRLQDAAGTGAVSFRRGEPGAIPLAADWAGRGTDGTGYYDPRNAWFHLRNRPSGGPSTHAFPFGPPGMIPLAGDWDGSGRTGIGYYNPATGWFYLRDHLSAGPAQHAFKFGPAGMKPLAGSWTGGRADEIGFYNPGTGWFHLRDHLSAGRPSDVFKFGPKGMVPLAGNWAGA